MADADTPRPRPLSPHLTIYKPILTMVMSIFHRITGVGLYGGMIFFAWWLLMISGGRESFETAQWFFGSFIGRLILFGLTWALMHHLLGGLRHFIWDTASFMDKVSREFLARATIIGSVGLTFLLWIVAYAVM